MRSVMILIENDYLTVDAVLGSLKILYLEELVPNNEEEISLGRQRGYVKHFDK